MGFFGRKDKKKAKQEADVSAPATRHPASRQQSQQTKEKNKRKSVKMEQDVTSIQPTLEMLPQLIRDLQTATETSGEVPARALRLLFALSEASAAGTNTRIAMVRRADQQLIPTLLNFLQRCDKGTSEQYLTLLVLNNISIPPENKRLIAVVNGGMKLFCRFLCDDPSCRLMAIVLVNLTFCDAELRRELVSPHSNIELVEALSYALRVSTLTEEEHDGRSCLTEADFDYSDSISAQLTTLMTEDRRILAQEVSRKHHLINPSTILFPETARWCLSALKNLTRPSRTDMTAAQVLVKMDLLDLVVRMIRVGNVATGQSEHSHSSSSPSPSDPLDHVEPFANAPWTWVANGIQDGALFVVMNFAASPLTRHAVRDVDGINVLNTIANPRCDVGELSLAETETLQWQALKARMAISYVIGSEGHFGQSRARSTGNVYAKVDSSIMVLSGSEVDLMVELLANTMNNIGKDGPGGYSAATFNVKWVLFAIRCLLTKRANQAKFVQARGERLNVLLLKALAQHAVEKLGSVDAEAAEHACFSLYLQSNYGFRLRFLPALFGNHDKIAGTGSLIAKILSSYLESEGITAPGRHAADQLLLRLPYLAFSGSMAELGQSRGLPTSAFLFEESLLQAAELSPVTMRKGTRPRNEIFGRPILRRRAPKSGTRSFHWNKQASSTTVFPNALTAVHDLSFGSKFQYENTMIDDILIANNIASIANGEKAESYSFIWQWQDAAESIQPNLLRNPSESSMSVWSQRPVKDDGPMAIFGLRCGPICGTDTSYP